jgi:hypothetical protein
MYLFIFILFIFIFIFKISTVEGINNNIFIIIIFLTHASHLLNSHLHLLYYIVFFLFFSNLNFYMVHKLIV